MKKILLFAGVMFLSTAILTSCGSKDEKKGEEKKEEKKEDAKDGEGEESEETSAPTGAWTQEVQDAYVNSCFASAKAGMKEEVAREYCDCTLGKIMEKYPDPAALANLGQDEITTLAMQCMSADMMSGK